jgi:small subunit ribosomal protein S9
MANKQTTTNAPVAHGVGRRKTAVARIWLRRGNGHITVNGKDHLTYFDTQITADVAATPFKVCPIGADFDVEVNVIGGSKIGNSSRVC